MVSFFRHFVLSSLFVSAVCAQTPPPAAPADAQLNTDALYDLGRDLFEIYAPEEVKQQYEFPTREQWNGFLPRLKKALEGNSLEDLAAMEGDTRAALKVLQYWPEGAEFSAWLHERLDLIEGARDLLKQRGATSTVVPGKPVPPTRPASLIPAYDFWLARLRSSAVPADAPAVLPAMRRAFTLERTPPELVWLAEVESAFQSQARSPAGAKGFFQFMPETAKRYGLSISMPDDRCHPERSAAAAARLLRTLFREFKDWPLALAAYNAGDGRVRRLLQKKGATTFAGIADSLPVETRLYVPKVLATVELRTGITPDKLGKPGA